jgi:hypothetical protein
MYYEINLYQCIIKLGIYNYFPETKIISTAYKFGSVVYLKIVLYILLIISFLKISI